MRTRLSRTAWLWIALALSGVAAAACVLNPHPLPPEGAIFGDSGATASMDASNKFDNADGAPPVGIPDASASDAQNHLDAMLPPASDAEAGLTDANADAEDATGDAP